MRISDIAEYALGEEVDHADLLRRTWTHYRRFQSTAASVVPESDEAVAIALGSYLFGFGLHKVRDDCSLLQQIRRFPAPDHKLSRGFRQLAWSAALSEAMIAEATACLPAEAHHLAEKWKAASSADGQKDVLRRFYALVLERPAAKGARKLESAGQHFLPRLVGRWEEARFGNCLFITLLLTAFAKLAGARSLIALPIHSALHEVRSYRGIVEASALMSLTSQGIPAFAAQGSTAFEKAMLEESHWVLFHGALAIQLLDGSWYLLDPYQRSQGVIRYSSQLTAACGILRKYRALPGLSAFCCDRREQTFPVYLCAALARWQVLFEQLRRLADQLRDADDARDAMRIFRESHLLQTILSAEGIRDTDISRHGIEAIARRYLFDQLPRVAGRKEDLEFVVFDHQLRTAVLTILGRYILHLVLKEHCKPVEEAYERGENLHRALEVHRASPALGALVLHDLAVQLGANEILETMALWMFSQVTVHDAILLGKLHGVRQNARAFPEKHALLRQVLCDPGEAEAKKVLKAISALGRRAQGL